MRVMISAVVLTKNEEENIEACLKSLEWCDEIIVIDDYSEDETLKNVQMFKCSNVQKELKVFQRHLNNDFAGQRNFGLKKAKGDWVLFVDADERISESLASEIKLRVTGYGLKVNGFYFQRKDFFLGQQLRHGETPAIKLLRLGRKNSGLWEGKVHEIWKVQGEIGQLKNPILHYHSDLKKFLQGLNHFSTLTAQEFYEQGKRVTFQEWLKPPAKFIQNYFFRLGFLDGTAGFVQAILMSFHSFLVRAKLFMLWKN